MKSTRIRKEKGITLIALIITIVVLMVLAAVAISSIQNDGIIKKAQDAANKYTEAQEKEQISLALTEWSLLKYTQAGTTLASFLGTKFGASNVVDNGDGTITITTSKGDMYKVEENGTITPAKGISIAGEGIPLTLEEGTTITGTLKATLVGIRGEITWSNENNSVATISGTTGESITVTAVANGETKVTASCSGYSAEYTVKVKEPSILKVGSYVEYDVTYTDMYTGIVYDNSEEGKYGWRYLGTDGENKLLISTAIPAIVYYSYKTGTLPTWWATDAEVQADTAGIYKTTAGWDYKSGQPNKYATYGLRYKFESIPFTWKESGTSVSAINTGIFRQVGSATSGTSINLNFRASGVAVEGVHNLTLAELNRAVNSARGNNNRADTDTSGGFKSLGGDALGLFDLSKLPNYNSTVSDFWLATPYTGMYFSLYMVYTHNEKVIYTPSNTNYTGGSNGVRPVVTLSVGVEMVDENGDGVFEIK